MVWCFVGILLLGLWGCAACHQPPKFELPITQEGMVYKIWDSVYTIVQNEYKIMIQFFMLKLHLEGLHFTSPPNLNCRWRKREWCTKFGTRCTKLYKISTKFWYTFRSRNPFWVAGDMYLEICKDFGIIFGKLSKNFWKALTKNRFQNYFK